MNNVKTLATLLLRAVYENMSAEAALMFSGGIDSSLIGHVAKRFGDVHAYTVGTAHSYDVQAAEKAIRLLNISHEIITIDKTDVEEGLVKLLEIDSTQTAIELSFNLPIYFVCQRATETTLLTGQGSDELFGGYYKYKQSSTQMHADLQKVLDNTAPKEITIAATYKKNLKMPYLHPEIIKFSQTLPLSEKLNSSSEKIILRKAAMFLGLPEELALRKKKAVQYGSGINKLMKMLAKEQKMKLHEYVKFLKMQITEKNKY